MQRIQLREGLHFAVTWGIPDDFGGMTGAMLHRSRAFARLGGVHVDVLTFDARPDYQTIERRLRESGQLVDGVGLLNLWDWLREHRIPAQKSGTPELRPLDAGDPTLSVGLRGDAVVSRTRTADDGETVLQVDHYRPDGTLVASDRRDVKHPGALGGRSIVLCDEQGAPVRSFNGAWKLYRWWLDQLRDGQPATFIVDSKTSARFMLEYRRPDVVTMHLVHASHLEGPADAPRLRASRREVLENASSYDGIVFLTERQRADAAEMLGGGVNFSVIPNGRDIGDARPPIVRERSRGIVLASLDRRKRVEHAVRAVGAARAAGEDVTLDVFGDGPERETVEREAARVGDSVTLHGYDRTAADRFATASFLLLTSRSEGLPLVLVESMAAGCLPIAYDIDYGPSDIIDDGVNGFLVQAGDIEALAAAIGRLQRMPASDADAMRAAAMKTAEAYTDEAVTRRWADEIDRASQKPDSPLDGQAGATAARLRRGITRRLRRMLGSR